MSEGHALRVVLEAGSLVDGRATAGIGRYVRSLTAALRAIPELELTLSIPARPPRSERHQLRYLHAQPRLLATAVRARPDIVHAVTSEPVAGWPLSRQVVTVHDVIPWTARPSSRRLSTAYFGLQRLRLRRAAAVITVSRTVADDVASVLGVDPGRIHVVPEGVAPVFTAEPRRGDGSRREALGAEGTYVLWAGSLLASDPRKALDVLVAAMRSVTSARAGVRLVMAGRRGREADRVGALGASDSVPITLTGFVSDEDLAALYRGAAAVVVPSLHEGFGLTVLEAMACGAPVVASRAGNIPDLAGDAAALVAPGDPRSLADALIATIDGDWGALRDRGPERARQYTWERAARDTVDVYRTVTAWRRSNRPT